LFIFDASSSFNIKYDKESIAYEITGAIDNTLALASAVDTVIERMLFYSCGVGAI